jgi:superfamily II DNA or RNA helicase
MAEGSVTFADVVVGARLSGLLPGVPVTVLAVQPFGQKAMKVTYELVQGETGQRLIYDTDLAGLQVEAKTETARPFDSDGTLFRLAAEALRIRMAGQFDPMLAVHTSELEPLPHQIKAVYGELLPRTPLRFLLADDPGAGKTIMAGLYIKELLLRGGLARCLIVAPGGLVEQWQEELHDKFGLRFDLLSRELAEATLGETVFDRHPLLIARMDQLSRSEDLREQLERSSWDLVVVDEAHRMSAHYFGRELKQTKRYGLGKMLGRIARHLLLMTATPHAGKEEDFQLFLGLLDHDRFEGRYRSGTRRADPAGLMRRMVKEQLLTFEGKPLFPERRAQTVPYELSSPEQDLYDAVTDYVRLQWNRVDELRQAGQKGRGNTVGFALTVLQRRLASSPEAILRSLERRRQRLEQRKHDLAYDDPAASSHPANLLRDDIDINDEDYDAEELEQFEEDVVDAATAARTGAELDAEIAVLAQLETVARRVHASGQDRKWIQLRDLLLDSESMRNAAGQRRKLIIFSEHRDTLNYLVSKIRTLLGSHDAVVEIHGGTRREARREIQQRFTQDKDCLILVATDAAGEGLNLQRAHLMVNYDLPWNPNRLEQRFGRIHRIGQTEVCHLWNLVAAKTREGAVFHRLLTKLEVQRKALGDDKVFDVLGDAFDEQPLRDLLIEAVRYGDQPERREKLNTIIDATVTEGIPELLRERALHRDIFSKADLESVRRQMEEAQARRLQPHLIQAFFIRALTELGGRINRRDGDRFEITNVPARLRERAVRPGIGGRVLRRYERVCFDRDQIRVPGKPKADLMAPGHPLLDAVVDVIIEQYGDLLRRGAILVDERDPGDHARLMVALTQQLVDGHNPPQPISERFDFVELADDGSTCSAGAAPYLDYRALTDDESELLAGIPMDAMLPAGAEDLATAWAIEHGMSAHLDEVRNRTKIQVERIRGQVVQRLTQEIMHLYGEAAELEGAAAAGKKTRRRPETSRQAAEELERRRDRRLAELDRDEAISPQPPLVVGAALVLPIGLLRRLAGDALDELSRAKETALVERRAVDAVLAAERALGRVPIEMPHNNPGYDVQTRPVGGGDRIDIEVKGRVVGAVDFYITRTEVFHAKNMGAAYRLALVAVDVTHSPEYDEVRYIENPFLRTEFGNFEATGATGHWAKTWATGRTPW